MCVEEIRAVLAGQDAWKAWLAVNKKTLYECLDPGGLLDGGFLTLIENAGKEPVEPRAARDTKKADAAAMAERLKGDDDD